MAHQISIHTAFIKLDTFLKKAGAFPTGGLAKQAIQDGKVFVNGSPCEERGRKLYPSDKVSKGNDCYEVTRDVD